MEFSKRANQVSPSATLAVSTEAKKMQAAGIDVVNLSTGEPDFATPKAIIKAAMASMQSGKASYYTPVGGLPELRQAVATHIKADTGYDAKMEQVAVTVGAKMGLFETFQALLNEGDEVMIVAPFWVSYEEQVKLAGGSVIAIHPQASDLKTTPSELSRFKTASTKLLILNTPQNPSGLVYSEEETRAIAQWAVDNNVILVADEIYGKLVYNGAKFSSVMSMGDEIVNNTILIDGVSKAYAMTGWRIGYVVATPQIIRKILALQGHMTSNPTAVAQYAALEALRGDQKPVEEMRLAFEKRLNQTFDLMQTISGFSFDHKPEGAFYLFPNVTEAMKIKGYATSTDLAMALLKEAHVAVVAGEAFGMPGHIRLSYATSQTLLSEAVRRIKAFMK
ncbi:pyridoxal phosphate-dependent aminotransferase [Pediococcus pentosaceus]|uniref:pyridoxal phosphate-dependent aminotransferase n=1 Tax=Pediococcus pentosaceus TaxID=1255 RepID=UPI00223BFA00|nr:pyridoxal phosphate-dependent aminotransferase [Pediococcus pentosaceus]MCT1177863.1 pyridoxal phosphate-dependent aminotransferase [Pediococcus pentosaceus]